MTRLAALSLIMGILLFSPFPGISSENRGGKEEVPSIEAPKGGTVTPSPSEEQKEKLLPQKIPPPGSTIVYQPPLRGAPVGRVGGGTRGIKDELFTLFLLVPDHVGRTVQEQPTLYWHLSKLTTYPIEITIIEDQAISPLLRKRINPPVQPGIQKVRLVDYHVHLWPKREYWWFVAVIPDPDRRSKDILAGGLIERVEIPELLLAQLAQAEKGEIPRIYAQAGIWYDTLMAISDLIDANPKDTDLRNQRAALLNQVGLSEIAEYERRQGSPPGQ